MSAELSQLDWAELTLVKDGRLTQPGAIPQMRALRRLCANCKLMQCCGGRLEAHS